MNITKKTGDIACRRRRLLGYVDTDAVVSLTLIVLVIAFFVLLASMTPGRQSRSRLSPVAGRAVGSRRVAPRQPAAGADDPDLAVFISFVKIVNATSYNNTFPVERITFGWRRYPTPATNVYAFSSDSDGYSIYLVPEAYQRNWAFNYEAAAHEMAHLAVGCRRWHDQVFERELRRLREGRVVKSFAEVQAESGL
jgi:hypothetical protein